MELTRNMFFKSAAKFLYSNNGQDTLTYKECIEKAERLYGITHEQLRELCSEGVESIKV